MKNNQDIWSELLNAEHKARSGKVSRLFRSPFLYSSLMVFNQLLYPVFKKGVYIKSNTFFDLPIRTLLPSGTDIALNGIKSHDSEIRLTKYLARELQAGDTFIDIGAHYGYYSLLASALVGNTGKVYSVEASASSFRDLRENIDAYENIKAFHAAAGDQKGMITFYEYPGPYAEYNTTVPGLYTNQKWYRHVNEKVNTIPIIILDDLIREENVQKAIIKIDVEGGETSVLRGLKTSLKEKQLKIAMEYLLPAGGSTLHHEAADLLYNNGYQSFAITRDGKLISVISIDEYLKENELTSDNVVFLNR